MKCLLNSLELNVMVNQINMQNTPDSTLLDHQNPQQNPVETILPGFVLWVQQDILRRDCFVGLYRLLGR